VAKTSKVKILREIEDHLERADARYDRFVKIEALKEKDKRRERILNTGIGIAAILCALYAIYLQF
jgi:hypothetical protein